MRLHWSGFRSRPRRQVCAALACLFLTGIGTGAWLRWRSSAQLELRWRRATMPPPVRRTPLFVAGGGADAAALDLLSYDTSVIHRSRFGKYVWLRHCAFYCYVLYRMLLLLIRIAPLAWTAFLTFALHTCPRRVFFTIFRDFLVSMGPSYVKLGQWMATRPDFFPPELCSVLEQLFDNTSAHAWSHTERLLRRPCSVHNYDIVKESNSSSSSSSGGGGSSGVAMHDSDRGDTARTPYRNTLSFFSEIERVPVNSGSIAQVHRAVLRESVDGLPAGTELAIKVTHPRIREHVAADLTVMRAFVAVANVVVPGIEHIHLARAIREFSRLIGTQLNLLIEADNLQQFIYNFRYVDGVHFPRPLPSLCSEDVLVETFERGVSLQHIDATRDNRDAAALGCHMFLKMLFEDNFVHSDLHPGNLLLRVNDVHGTSGDAARRGDGGGGGGCYYADGKRRLAREIVVLDAGLVTTLSKRERNNFVALFAAVACGDGELGADLMLDRMPDTPSSTHTHPRVDRVKFRREMKAIFDTVAPGTHGFRLSDVDIGRVLSQIVQTVRANKAPLDGNFTSLVLTVIVGEGLGRKLSPHFNLFAEAAPYLVAFLEHSELAFLANKLRDTYGTTALLRDSIHFVQTDRAPMYVSVLVKRCANTLRSLLTPLCDSVDVLSSR